MGDQTKEDNGSDNGRQRIRQWKTTDQTMEDNRPDNGRQQTRQWNTTDKSNVKTMDKTTGGQRTRQWEDNRPDNGQENRRTTDLTKGGQEAMVRRTMNNGEEGNRQWR